MKLDQIEGKPDDKVAWGSDIAAQMLRRFNIPFISLNPGASYRGFHDSLVNHLGNENPGIIRLPARRSFGRDRARLRQGDRRADGLRPAQQRRPAARHDGHLQRVVRPRADAHAGRDRTGCFGKAPSLDRLDPHLARQRRLHPFAREVGRSADVGAGARGSDGAREHHHAHRADRAGLCRVSTPASRRPSSTRSRSGRT